MTSLSLTLNTTDPRIANSIDEYDHLAINTAETPQQEDSPEIEFGRAESQQVQAAPSAWADVSGEWDSVQMAVAVPDSPTTSPPETVEETDMEFSWTHGKVIGKNKHSVTFVEHATGAIGKARPKDFAYNDENGKSVFINLDTLAISKGDYVRFCKTETPPDGWDASKGGKDVSFWVLECALHLDQITHNGKALDNEVANDITCSFNGKVNTTGAQFSFFDVAATQVTTDENGEKSSSINKGIAFCDASVCCKGVVRNALVEGTCLPFQSTSKSGKQTDFIILSIDKVVSPKAAKPSNTQSSRRKNMIKKSTNHSDKRGSLSSSYGSSQGNTLGL
jgi:hypothetical protein